MNRELAERISAAGMTLAGSLLAVEPSGRLNAAAELWAWGAWAHADVIGGGYGTRPSVTLDEIRTLAAAGGPIDVHLMVDDVSGWLAALPTGLARVTIQSERLPDDSLDGLITLARQRAHAVWLGVDTDTAQQLPAVAADGVLHMLVPPAVAGHTLDPERLAGLSFGPAERTGVDGGVTADHVDAIVGAGAGYVVVGRSLFTAPAIHKENAR